MAGGRTKAIAGSRCVLFGGNYSAVMHPGLFVALALLAGLIIFGLRGWERLVRIRRQQEPTSS